MPSSRLLWWGGLAAAACGAVLCVIGWYGISGERVAEQQIPYLASATVPGAALLVAGAVLVAGACRSPDDEAASGERATGYEGDAPPEDAPRGPSSDAPPVRVPGGTLAHRPDCPLVAARDVTPAEGDPSLTACPVCEPGT